MVGSLRIDRRPVRGARPRAAYTAPTTSKQRPSAPNSDVRTRCRPRPRPSSAAVGALRVIVLIWLSELSKPPAQGAECQGGGQVGRPGNWRDGRFGKQTLCQLSYSRSGG